MQIVDRSDPARLLGTVDAPTAAALRRVHDGSANDTDRHLAKTAIRDIRAHRAWLRCSCPSDGALLAPARLAETYYLRRLTSRSPHAPGCPFHHPPPLPDGSVTAHARIRPNTGAFCRPLLGHRELTEQSRHAKPAFRPRQAPQLAIALWRLIELAGLNTVDTSEHDTDQASLTSQLAAIRLASRRISVTAAIRLNEVLTTFPGDAAPRSRWHAKAMAALGRFLDDEKPQAFMIGLARSADGATLSTAAGAIACESDVAFMSATARHAGPPFLFMLVGRIDSDHDSIAPARAFAQPVLSASHLVPVDSHDERRMLGAALAFQRSAMTRFPSLRISIEKPLFDEPTSAGLIRRPVTMTIQNIRTGGVQYVFLLRAGQNKRPLDDDAMRALTRVLTIPADVLACDEHRQAAWFVEAIYGATGAQFDSAAATTRRAADALLSP